MKDKLLKLSALTLAVSASLSSMPLMAQDLEGLKFWGYGRGGFGASDDRVLNKETDQAHNGINIIKTAGNPYKPTGRLGNENNQVELHFDYGISNNGMNWIAHTNVFSGLTQGDLNMDEWWVEGKGVFTSNPEAKVWIGKRYYNRFESMLNSYQLLNTDGTGAGIDNFDVGFGKLNFGITTQLHFNNATGGNDFQHPNGDKGYRSEFYAVSSRLNDIAIADNITGAVFFNYGFNYGSDNDLKLDDGNGNVSMSKSDHRPNAYQLGFAIEQGKWADHNRLVVRYSSNTGASLTQDWIDRPDTQLGAYFEGMQQLTNSIRIEYLWGTEIADYDAESLKRDINSFNKWDKSTWNQFVVRPTYAWNERHSTQLELAYDTMDFEALQGYDSGKNTSYKVTLAHNIHINSGYWDRPVLRFFATYGELDTKTLVFNESRDSSWDWRYDQYSKSGKESALTFGAMFEAWW